MRMNIFSQNPESSHPKTCLFICVFNSVFKLLMFFFFFKYMFYVTPGLLRKGKQDAEMSHGR